VVTNQKPCDVCGQKLVWVVSTIGTIVQTHQVSSKFERWPRIPCWFDMEWPLFIFMRNEDSAVKLFCLLTTFYLLQVTWACSLVLGYVDDELFSTSDITSKNLLPISFQVWKLLSSLAFIPRDAKQLAHPSSEYHDLASCRFLWRHLLNTITETVTEPAWGKVVHIMILDISCHDLMEACNTMCKHVKFHKSQVALGAHVSLGSWIFGPQAVPGHTVFTNLQFTIGTPTFNPSFYLQLKAWNPPCTACEG